MSLRIIISGPARRDLRRLDLQDVARVLDAIDRLAAMDAGDVKRLQGSRELRLRVGRLRVLFERNRVAGTLTILRVLPRDRAYRE